MNVFELSVAIAFGLAGAWVLVVGLKIVFGLGLMLVGYCSQAVGNLLFWFRYKR